MGSAMLKNNSPIKIVSENEEIFRSASDELFKIFADATLGNELKVSGMLDVSLEYYGLDTAIISSITGATSVLTAMASTVAVTLPVGSAVALGSTPDKECIKANGHSAKQHCDLNEFEYRSDSHVVSVGSYIATTLGTINGPYGSVSFSSANARVHEFNEYDWKYLSLIANLLGCFLSNAEQIDFIEKQNEYYKSLFASIPAVMFLCDSDGLIISASDQFAKTVDQPLDAVPGHICMDYFDARERNAVRIAIAQGRAVQLPAKLLQKENHPLEVEINISVKPIGTMRNIRMVIANDVSARNAALREVTEQNQLLKKANEGLNQFAFVASHDLQEPLRKIQQFSSFLEEDLAHQLDNDSEYHLRVIVESSQRMSQLIKDLLMLSKTSSVDPEMMPICLNELVASVAIELEPLIKESGANLKLSELPKVQGNARLLGQLFTNLLSNSIRYRSADRDLELHVSMSRDKDQTFIHISDNGIGFDMNHVNKIFEPFHRLHRSKDLEGSGIGLAICSAVCQKHGWSIDASSDINVGSVFSINITHTS